MPVEYEAPRNLLQQVSQEHERLVLCVDHLHCSPSIRKSLFAWDRFSRIRQIPPRIELYIRPKNTLRNKKAPVRGLENTATGKYCGTIAQRYDDASPRESRRPGCPRCCERSGNILFSSARDPRLQRTCPARLFVRMRRCFRGMPASEVGTQKRGHARIAFGRPSTAAQPV